MRLPEQRRHPRVTTALLVQYRQDLLEGYRVEYATDVSRSGLFVRTDRPHPAGALVQFQLTPRDGAALIEGLGRVVRATPPQDAQAGNAAGMAIEFLGFDRDMLDALEQRVLVPAARA